MIFFTRTQAQVTIALLVICKHALKYEKPIEYEGWSIPKPLMIALSEFLFNYELISDDEVHAVSEYVERCYHSNFNSDSHDSLNMSLSILPLFDGYISNNFNSLNTIALKKAQNNGIIIDNEIQTLMNEAIKEFQNIPFTNMDEMTILNKIAIIINDVHNQNSDDIKPFITAFNKLMLVINKKFIRSYNIMRYCIAPFIPSASHEVVRANIINQELTIYRKFMIFLSDETSEGYQNFVKMYHTLSARPETNIIKEYNSFNDFTDSIKSYLPDHGISHVQNELIIIENAIIKSCIIDDGAFTYYTALMDIDAEKYNNQERYIAASIYGILMSLLLY